MNEQTMTVADYVEIAVTHGGARVEYVGEDVGVISVRTALPRWFPVLIVIPLVLFFFVSFIVGLVVFALLVAWGYVKPRARFEIRVDEHGDEIRTRIK